MRMFGPEQSVLLLKFKLSSRGRCLKRKIHCIVKQLSWGKGHTLNLSKTFVVLWSNKTVVCAFEVRSIKKMSYGTCWVSDLSCMTNETWVSGPQRRLSVTRHCSRIPSLAFQFFLLFFKTQIFSPPQQKFWEGAAGALNGNSQLECHTSLLLKSNVFLQHFVKAPSVSSQHVGQQWPDLTRFDLSFLHCWNKLGFYSYRVDCKGLPFDCFWNWDSHNQSPLPPAVSWTEGMGIVGTLMKVTDVSHLILFICLLS